MYKIKFKYRDKLSNWEWREQSCTVSSVFVTFSSISE